MTWRQAMRSETSDAIEPWLDEVWDERGTDLLLTAGAPPLIRVDGEMRPVTGGRAVERAAGRAARPRGRRRRPRRAVRGGA